MLKIRLRRQGRTNRAAYRIVVAESRSPRDGKYQDTIGWYHPEEKAIERKIAINEEKLAHWINLGAKFTEKCAVLIDHAAPELRKRIGAC